MKTILAIILAIVAGVYVNNSMAEAEQQREEAHKQVEANAQKVRNYELCKMYNSEMKDIDAIEKCMDRLN